MGGVAAILWPAGPTAAAAQGMGMDLAGAGLAGAWAA